MVNVISYNVYNAIGPPLSFNGTFERALRHADTLYANINKDDIDIIALQENIVHRKMTLRGFIHHPYKTGEMISSFTSKNIRMWPSGLTILSRFPIVKQIGMIFDVEAYHYETMAAKGVLYAAVLMNNNKIMHVFNTHLQAWNNAACVYIRKQQLQQVATFIEKQQISKNEPVIVCGDFNVDVHDDVFINNVSSIGTVVQLAADNKNSFTFDPLANDLVGYDAINEYVSPNFDKSCYHELLLTGKCVCCPRELIDGVIVSTRHLEPKSAVSHVVINKAHEPFEIAVSVLKSKFTKNVSDHFPVLCKLCYDDDKWATSSFTPSNSKLQMDGQEFSLAWFSVWFSVFILVIIGLLLVFVFIQRGRRSRRSRVYVDNYYHM